MNITLPPLRPNNRATVEVDRIYDATGLLTYITLRPIRRAGDRYANLAIFNAFASRLRSDIYRNVRAQRPGWSDVRIRNQLRVSIFMTNWTNLGQSSVEEDVQITNINGHTFVDMFERATANGSNPTLDIYDVMWKVWINPASLIEGGEDNDPKPEPEDFEKKSGIVKNTKLFKDDGTVGCAAHALAVGLDLKNVDRKTRRDRDGRFTQFCKDLQDKLEFEFPKRATIFELQKFVRLYPDYRLVVIQTVFTNPFIIKGIYQLTRSRVYPQ